MLSTRAYTPEQVAETLQLSKNTVYQMIKQGEIAAKKFGKVYRIPPIALSFMFTGLDEDLYQAQKEDLKNLKSVKKLLKEARENVWEKSKSF